MMLLRHGVTLHTDGCFFPENLFAAVIRKASLFTNHIFFVFTQTMFLAESGFLHFSLAFSFKKASKYTRRSL